jgi:histidyl-tRNA synthetase
MQYKTVKGMSDITFPEMKYWHFIEDNARTFFGRRLYEEIRTPLVEYTELFQRSIGETSDIVNKEMYTFEDRGGRSLTLRPEMTASVIRAVVNENLLGVREPLKVLYLGQMFRAERPQAGRKRQFYQIGVEVIGNDFPFCDVEVIRDLAYFLFSLGFTEDEIAVKINNVGCNECRPAFLGELRTFFQSHLSSLCESCNFKYEKNVLRIFDCKNDACRAISAQAPKVTDNVCNRCQNHFSAVIDGLDLFHVPYSIDKNMVRGLDYYTSTVFEVTSSKLGAQDAIAAGGRYNNLLKELGGPDKGAIGFALGVERLLICLQNVLKTYQSDIVSKTIYIAYAHADYLDEAKKMIAKLERSGFATYIDCDSRSLKSQLKRANKFGFRWVMILNNDEIEKGMITIKDLSAQDGGQLLLSLNDIEAQLREIIN